MIAFSGVIGRLSPRIEFHHPGFRGDGRIDWIRLGLRHDCPLQVQQEPGGPKLLIGGPEMDGVSKLFGRFCVFQNLEMFPEFSLPAVPGVGRWIMYSTTIS